MTPEASPRRKFGHAKTSDPRTDCSDLKVRFQSFPLIARKIGDGQQGQRGPIGHWPLTATLPCSECC